MSESNNGGLDDKTILRQQNTTVYITTNNQIIDTVDYYQLGRNRYMQLFKKYDFEQNLYEKQKIIDADKNVEIYAKEQAGLVTYGYKKELFNTILQNRQMNSMLLEENRKSIDNVVKLSQQIYDSIVDFLTENFKKLNNDQIVNTQTLLVTFREISAELNYVMEKYSILDKTRQTENHYITLTSIINLQTKIKTAIHGMSTDLVSQFGAIRISIADNASLIQQTLDGIRKNETTFQTAMENLKQEFEKLQDELKNTRLTRAQIEILEQQIDGFRMAGYYGQQQQQGMDLDKLIPPIP